ncbi:MAG: glutamate--tRNA ligase [Actinomycetota bacterium]|nr:glutamate--tRNA ligase [Actinomycetota bacterium]
MTEVHPKVRVRFAPAPSGSLHVGNARSALFNWAYARHFDGAFVLRIEDTDASRATGAAMHDLMDVLRWLGLNWDEGPDVGGRFAPYRQSERFDLYRRAAEGLVRSGRAYHCYCTPEELDQRRKEAMAAGRPPGYDGRCRTLSDVDRAKLEGEGRPHALRFWVQEGATEFQDLVRGAVRFENNQIPDFVIVRSDGSPTYLLAAGHDDLAMEITHVIRGEDLLSATPRQLMLYEAMGFRNPPKFAHMPLIVGADRQPLSKRHGQTSVEHYRSEGFLPEAMVNYMALLGWSFGDGTTERFTREQLVEQFALEAVSHNPAAFDVPKLTALNGEYIRGLPVDELARRLTPFTGEVDDVLLLRVVPLVQERIAKLTEAAPMLRFFFTDEPPMDEAAVAKFLNADFVEALDGYLNALSSLGEWDHASIETAMRGVQEKLGLKKKTAFMPVRVAVTGSLISPPLFESLEILGREPSLARIRAGLDRAKTA